MSLLFDSNNELERNKIHSCSGDEFIRHFCVGETRQSYVTAIVNIFDYARKYGARRVFVGGSFILLSEPNPYDFDCVIVFNKADDIPNFVDSSLIGEIEFDILFASEDQPQTLDAFINLFQTYKNGIKEKPVVEVLLDHSLDPWQIRFIPDDDQAEVIKKVYAKRTVIERRKSRGILFSIHGVNTKAFWNSKLSPLAGSQGWIFAPFIYENPIRLLFSPKKRRKVLESFSSYYHEVTSKYQAVSASIITHSFGTYIIAKYLCNSKYNKFLDCQIDSIILTGGIVDKEIDWAQFYPQKIGRILNISSPNDGAVKLMPSFKFLKRWIMRDKDGIFGKIGVTGIDTKNTPDGLITNKEIEILNHCNVFKDEILTGVIMPFLNSNEGVGGREFLNKLIQDRIN